MMERDCNTCGVRDRCGHVCLFELRDAQEQGWMDD